MIKLIDNDYPTLLGKLGAWPSEFGPQAGWEIYSAISKLPRGSIVLDADATTGKSTVIAAAAAKRAGADLVAVPSVDASRLPWFERAIRLFSLDAVRVLPTIDSIDHATLIICRRAEPVILSKCFGGDCIVVGVGGVLELGEDALPKHLQDMAFVDTAKRKNKYPAKLSEAEIISEPVKLTVVK